MTNVVNAALAPFLNPTPGQPPPQNPILWAVLGWVRRQVQDTPFGKVVLNMTPEITSPKVVDLGGGKFQIIPSSDDSDPDEDDLTYSASNGVDGTVVKNDIDGTFTYTVTDPTAWDKTDTILLTASDARDYPHFHGLAGFFTPAGGHTASIEVTIKPTASATEVVELPEGHTVVGSGSGTVDADGKIYRATKYSNNGVDAYALVVQRPGGDTEIIELPGEPIGELAFGPEGTLYQNVQTPKAEGGYDYAMTVIAPAPAAGRFALIASNALDSGNGLRSVAGSACRFDGDRFRRDRLPTHQAGRVRPAHQMRPA